MVGYGWLKHMICGMGSSLDWMPLLPKIILIIQLGITDISWYFLISFRVPSGLLKKNSGNLQPFRNERLIGIFIIRFISRFEHSETNMALKYYRKSLTEK